MLALRLATFSFLLSLGQAQLRFLDEPVPLWSNPSSTPGGEGNECLVWDDEDLLLVTGSDGRLIAHNPNDGNLVWEHVPSSVTGNPIFGRSGISIGQNDAIGDFIVYGVSEGFAVADPSNCVVYALSKSGDVLWKSQALEGACSGTPVISNDGLYVFLTHNLVGSGHFSVLMAEQDGAVFYSYLDPNQPFSPPGILHEPQEGYFERGRGNRNDLLLWSYRPRPNEDGVGIGATFAFQFPVGFIGEADLVGVTPLANVTWQAIAAPVIMDNGYKLYYSVSRSSFRSWNGEAGDRPNQFDRGATNNVEFPRGDPKWQAVYASLQFTKNQANPLGFGGTAGNLFVGLDDELNELWRVETLFPVISEARISPDDSVVYYVEQNGDVHALETEDGTVKRWTRRLGKTSIVSDFCQSRNGKNLFFNDQSGTLQAWQVAIPPTTAPTTTPSDFPSSFPSSNPTSLTEAPTPTPTILGSQFPTQSSGSPTTSPTAEPTVFPTTSAFDPSAAPSNAPSTLAPSAQPTNATIVTPAPTSGTVGKRLEMFYVVSGLLMAVYFAF